MDRHRALVVADDLTGAADTGGRFAARGFETAVATGDRTPDAPVLVVDTDSRYADGGVAADRVADAVASHPADVVYKKVDSTLRGNVAAEVDAAVEAAGAALALVAPAFPAAGRTTVGDLHLVDGDPVAATAVADDAGGAVASSRLTDLLADSVCEVAHLPLETVAAGADAVADFLAERSPTPGDPLAVACDAARAVHLDAVAAAGARRDDALYVGSAGLAGHVRLGTDAGVLGVVGSTAPETLSQLDALPDGAVVHVADPLSEGAAATAADRAVETLADRGRAVVTAARSPADREATVADGRERGFSEAETATRVAATLAEAAAAVVDWASPGGLFLTGGAVARTVLEALGGDGVRLAGREVAAGVPVGRVAGGDADGLPVVTKAGGFGDGATIVNCLDALALADE
ncbi:MAG: four-carbon acid sugar kinase family protein [Halobacteriaceae archaeon]